MAPKMSSSVLTQRKSNNLQTTNTTSVPKPTPKKAAATKIKTTISTATTRTPVSKDKKVVPQTPSSTKKIVKRGPKPAHSGVPVPDKMRALLKKRLQELDAKRALSS